MISVLMCVYNETEYELRCSIESILAQSFDDFEFIIILDNPNNDLLLNVIYEYEKSDDRIRLLINSYNMGLIASLNKGLLEAKGDYVARMDADDISSRNRLLLQKEYLDSHKDISVVFGNAIYIDETGNIIKKNLKLDDANIRKIMRIRNCVIHPCTMFRKKNVLDLGGYREVFSVEDYDLWTRLLINGNDIGVIDKYLLKYRVRGNGISQKNAYIQRVLVKNIRRCFRKNKIVNIDSVGLIIKCISDDRKKRYNNAIMYYDRAWQYFNKHYYHYFLFYLFVSFFGDIEILSVLLDELVVYWYLK